MKQLYTLGPWKAVRRKAPQDSPARRIWDVSDTGGASVCRVFGNDAMTSCANAKLVRCAPELLEFVAEMARFIRQEKEELVAAGYGPPMASYLEQAEALVRSASLPAASAFDADSYREWV